MRSLIVKRSVVTSVSLEDEFWHALHNIASPRNITLGSLLDEIDCSRHQPNLSSHIRLFVLQHYRVQHAGPASGAPVESALPC
jgi:predicted DNA-binding ribbon-helix-helix protein